MASIGVWNSPSSWADAFGSTDLNSLANGSDKISTVTIDNSSNKHLYMDLSYILGSISPSGTPSISFFKQMQLHDGSTYADGETTGTAANQTTTTFLLRVAQLRTKASSAQNGGFEMILIPPSAFKLVFRNNSGVTLASSGNAVKYRTYSLNLNG